MSETTKSKLRILIIGAHPADIFDQSAGTMVHHTRRGDWVGCIALTHGARVHDKVIAGEMHRRARVPTGEEMLKLMSERSDIKSREVEAACALLGVEDVYFFGADDAVLLPNVENVTQLARLVRKLKPDIVITHFPKEDGDVGSAHATAGHITMLAINLASGVDVGDENPPHKVAQVYYFGDGAAGVRHNVFKSEGGYYNDIFIDISDVIELKFQALDQLESQGYAGDYARKRIETCDGAFGNVVGVAYAEGFIKLRATVATLLPLNDLEVELNKQSDDEDIRRRSRRFDPALSV